MYRVIPVPVEGIEDFWCKAHAVARGDHTV